MIAKPVLILILLYLNGVDSPTASGQEVKRPFTVADDIEMTHFEVDSDPARIVKFSPDRSYFVIRTERGRLDLNRCEDSLRFYRSEVVKGFLNKPEGRVPPTADWIVSFSTHKECPVIRDLRWLSDSSGVALLQTMEDGTQRLVLANVRKRAIQQFSLETDAVKEFDIRDEEHFVYTAEEPAQPQTGQEKRDGPLVVATGHDFYHLFFPDEERRFDAGRKRTNLWAVVGGKRLQVKNESAPLAYLTGALALSPDGRSLVALAPVRDIPTSWETLYPPSEKYAAWGIHAGYQDLSGSNPYRVNQYVRVDLETGAVRVLVDAPSSADTVGWWTQGDPTWSDNGDAVLLPGTFLPSEQQRPSSPCVTVVDVGSGTASCVMKLKGQSSAESMHFVQGSRNRVAIVSYEERTLKFREYQESPRGVWNLVREIAKSPSPADFQLTLEESLNESPRLIATKNQISHVILDPNPQLENLESGSAGVYTWRANDGRVWRGGLYVPGNYERGKRYPLIIQTHGFVESRYIASGSFQAGFAARAFAAHGIVVLQVDDDRECSTGDSHEIPCAVSGYEAAARELAKERQVDAEKVGIIGFSHTCFWTIAALTANSSIHFKAALITDGIMADYNQYLMSDDRTAHYYDNLIGARPVGQGLRVWLERSPGFNLDRVAAPLMIVGAGRESLLSMWQPYAMLHFMKKPVDLIMLNTTEHDLSNPAVRLASQGGSVDWFRFWLQGYEDPDVAKVEQYKRWHELQKMQEAHDDGTQITDTP
jgi:dipeptidyl aminopeptidase/acylaminoacyl peptidase